MGKIIRKRVEFSGSSNRAENIAFDDTKNVKTKITEIQEQMIAKSDVVDNLLSTSADLPLSANQGKELNNKIANIKSGIALVEVIAENSVSNVYVTFDKPYTKNPTVIVTPSTSAPNNCFASVNNVTTNGFNVNLYRNSIAPTYVYWVALGE